MSAARTPGARVRFEDLTLGYRRRPAVHHLDGEVAPGALLAVVGPNGAGKSTLLKGIAGTLKPLAGRVSVEGAGAKPRVAYLPQAGDLDRRFPIRVRDLVAMGLWQGTGLWRGLGALRGLSRDDRTRVERAIAAVGLTGFEDRSVGALSGGQVQRALFARLLLQDAELVLLDEPFTAIDAATTADLLTLVRSWGAEGRTVLAVLHDLDLVREAFPTALLLAREPVAWGPTAEALHPANLLAARRMAESPDPGAEDCARAA